MSQEVPIGSRIRFFREQRGRTQRALAQAADISQDYLSEVERAIKVPTIATVSRLARELEVSVSLLIEGDIVTTDSAALAAMPAIQLALLQGGLGLDDAPIDLDVLRNRVDAAWQRWQNSSDRFSGSVAGLAELITDVERARHGEDPAANAIATDLYVLLQQVFKYNGWINLAIVATDRAAIAARASGDPIRVASADWCLGHTLRTIGQVDGAVEVAIKGMERLRSTTPDLGDPAAAMLGSLHLAAAFHLARQRNLGAARQHIQEGVDLAQRADGAGPAWIVFGRTNAYMHALAVELEVGRAAEGFRMADHIDVDSANLPVERATTYLVDLARLHNLSGNDAAVLHHLTRVEELSPEDVRYRPAARGLVRSVATGGAPTYAREARQLAKRVGVQI